VGVSHSRSCSMLSAYECMMYLLSLYLAEMWCERRQGGGKWQRGQARVLL